MSTDKFSKGFPTISHYVNTWESGNIWEKKTLAINRINWKKNAVNWHISYIQP